MSKVVEPSDANAIVLPSRSDPGEASFGELTTMAESTSFKSHRTISFLPHQLALFTRSWAGVWRVACGMPLEWIYLYRSRTPGWVVSCHRTSRKSRRGVPSKWAEQEQARFTLSKHLHSTDFLLTPSTIIQISSRAGARTRCLAYVMLDRRN
ncbi:uncharacterized protein EI90DRAFT_59325 [Cantharellus anzutake]|uniref:uncharacterized protein n=1 Tax=Cantharellus anzutake TaxID=1750568 RepID=UPI001904B495|nr:uncharacterized protein EI90DRAFT_59325 [Cantharellus anzutake]KAF8344228.1 hypothetical protein EI90DRAFT_59325 [Cantharellus anzutake]